MVCGDDYRLPRSPPLFLRSCLSRDFSARSALSCSALVRFCCSLSSLADAFLCCAWPSASCLRRRSWRRPLPSSCPWLSPTSSPPCAVCCLHPLRHKEAEAVTPRPRSGSGEPGYGPWTACNTSSGLLKGSVAQCLIWLTRSCGAPLLTTLLVHQPYTLRSSDSCAPAAHHTRDSARLARRKSRSFLGHRRKPIGGSLLPTRTPPTVCASARMDNTA
jgi:hypothetical protein